MNFKTENFHFFFFVTIVFLVSVGAGFIYKNYFKETVKINYPIKKNNQEEIALIYIGCSTCPAAQDDNLSKSFIKLSEKIEKFCSTNGYEFFKIGISSEQEFIEGLKHLKSVGEFNEISVGNGLGNTSLQKYMWDNYIGMNTSALPQLLITKRVYKIELISGEEKIHPEIVSEGILERVFGLAGINSLLENDKIFTLLKN